jgi:hypothetical protein
VPVARIDINRIDIAVLVSVILHALLAMLPPIVKDGEKRSKSIDMPFVATIVNTPMVKAEPTPDPVPPVVRPVVRPRPAVAPKAVAIAPPPVPVPMERPVERLIETPRAPQVDMMASINARRAQRKQLEDALVAQEQARSAANPGSSDPLANIARNLQTLNSASEDGTGGVFQILSKGTRTGEFAFNGFRPDTNRRWREVIEVDAGQGGDLERAMVRRMIELIRTHYTGDFIWRSHRLGKSIVMSARPEDSLDLEDFLMREFFDTPTLAHSNGGEAPDPRFGGRPRSHQR